MCPSGIPVIRARNRGKDGSASIRSRDIAGRGMDGRRLLNEGLEDLASAGRLLGVHPVGRLLRLARGGEDRVAIIL